MTFEEACAEAKRQLMALWPDGRWNNYTCAQIKAFVCPKTDLFTGADNPIRKGLGCATDLNALLQQAIEWVKLHPTEAAVGGVVLLFVLLKSGK